MALRINFASGATRAVLLIGGWAIKFPHFGRGYQLGLHGILANLQEREWSCVDDRLCPVVWGDRCGLVLIMRRCEPIPEEQGMTRHFASYFDGKGWPGGVEIDTLVSDWKPQNFGVLNGKLVCLDYGS